MATQFVGEATKQMWDEVLTNLFNLSSTTVRRNMDLENRVAELEMELLDWKQAHSVSIKASEREVKAHNVQLAALNRQISNLDTFKSNQNALILCIIDGNQLIFNRELLAQGYQGGRSAAQQLTQVIAEQLSNEEIHVYAEDLSANNICSQEQLQAFLEGFTQSSPRFATVDVGLGKDFLESKIKEYIQIFTCFPQTLRVFFGGCNAMSYMSTLSSLEKDQLLGKIVMLYAASSQSCEGANDALNVFSLPRLAVDGILAEKPSRLTTKPTPLATGSYGTVMSNGGLISPQSPARPVGRVIDPSLVKDLYISVSMANADCMFAIQPLHKQNPPPCNEYYLMTCSKGASICKYSHEYILSPEQLESLASNAKKAPCNWLKNGVHCPYGDQCCWGHVCPNGPKCFHLSKGKCWFKGESMHADVSI